MKNNKVKELRLTIEYENQENEQKDEKKEVKEVQNPKRIDAPIMVEGNRQLLND